MGFSFTGQVADAKTSERDEHYKAGTYRVRIEKTKPFKDRKNIEYYIVEMTTLESNNASSPPGTKRSWMQKITGVDMAWGNIKNFGAAALGIDLKEVPEVEQKAVGLEIEEALNETLTNNDAFKGEELLLDVTEIITKEKKEPFNVHKFAPVPQGSQAAA